MTTENTNWKFDFFPKDWETIDFDAMEKSYLAPLINPMKACMQELKYHGEGDVWSHTKMALNYLISMKEFKDLSQEDKQIVFLAMLFHDVGKPMTTKTEEDVISSKGHSVKGARLTRESIINWNSQKITDFPFEIREHVCNLVLLHMLPVYLLEKENPLFSAASSSTVIKNRLLSVLATADIYGRICDEEGKKRTSERVELFSMFCEENKCYDTMKPFASERAKFRYFFEHKGHPDYDYFEPVHGEVIVMCGLQASGKDHVIKTKYPTWEVISLDQTRTDMDLDFGDNEPAVIQDAKEQCKRLMRSKTNFVFNATNVVKDIRMRWITLFRQYRYKVTIHYRERPLAVMLEANKNRDHVVPEEVILEKVKKIDIPTTMECHNLIMEIN